MFTQGEFPKVANLNIQQDVQILAKEVAVSQSKATESREAILSHHLTDQTFKEKTDVGN